MGFPSRAEIKKVLKKIEKMEGTLELPANPTVLQKFRWDICQSILIYKQTHKFSQKQVADLAGIDAAKMSKILHHRIDEFSTDRLISIYEKLNPKVQLKVS